MRALQPVRWPALRRRAMRAKGTSPAKQTSFCVRQNGARAPEALLASCSCATWRAERPWGAARAAQPPRRGPQQALRKSLPRQAPPRRFRFRAARAVRAAAPAVRRRLLRRRRGRAAFRTCSARLARRVWALRPSRRARWRRVLSCAASAARRRRTRASGRATRTRTARTRGRLAGPGGPREAPASRSTALCSASTTATAALTWHGAPLPAPHAFSGVAGSAKALRELRDLRVCPPLRPMQSRCRRPAPPLPPRAGAGRCAQRRARRSVPCDGRRGAWRAVAPPALLRGNPWRLRCVPRR